MSLSLYDVSVPAFLRAFRALSAILEKGRAFADETGLPHSALLEGRLIDDMGPLTMQIQRASDAARGAVVRVGQVEPVAMADEEVSFDDLQARIARTVDFLKAVPSDSMDGREQAEVTLPLPTGELKFTGKDYMLSFALPNFYFHVTTAYDILRHKGVPIGKRDFLGAV